MEVVIYCRYSTELQNPKSCDDQEREVRTGLARLGIDASNAVVIKDAAVSGTTTNRDGFDSIRERIRRRDTFLLAVDDQSRFSRLNNALSLVTDLVYARGRFISVCEHIDTTVEGWKLKVRVMELHHSTCSEEGGNRVRRGQRGRVLEGKSAGDFPYGYSSFPVDPEYAKTYCGRGPKPVMGLRIDRRQSKWVIWMFQQFVDGRSINWIARELTRQKVPRGRRARSETWYAPTIRSMLSNEKYRGVWTWGKTTTVHDSDGQKKQIPVKPDDVVIVERPELRIVPQELWEQTQQRLANLRQLTGYKPGQQSRLPKTHYTVAYPSDVLMTLLVCGYCGGKMHHAGSGKHVYRQCVNSIDGRNTCTEKLRVPAAKAKTVMLEFVADLLRNMPEWIEAAVEEMGAALKDFHSTVPVELNERRDRLRDAEQRVQNLLVIAEGGGVDDVVVFQQRLRMANDEAARERREVERLEALPPAELKMPDRKWLRKRLRDLAASLAANEADAARLLRELIGTVRVFRVVPVGKKFGYQQLRFHVSGWKTILEALRGHVPCVGLEILDKQRPAESDTSPEFCLDVGGPHKLDLLAPRIAEMRKNNVKWKDIAKETDLKIDSAFSCWRRYVTALKESAPPSLEKHDDNNESNADAANDDNDMTRGHGAA